MKQIRLTLNRTLARTALWCSGLAAACNPAVAQSGALTLPPALGAANYDNEYAPRQTLVASFNLDANPTGVTLTGSATITSAPGEVLSGSRSVKMAGATAMLVINANGLSITPGEIYALEYDYRIVDAAGAVSAMFVLARWGGANELHADAFGLRPAVYPSTGTQRRQFLFEAGGTPTFVMAPASAATVIVDNLRVWHIDAEAVRPVPRIASMGFPRLSKYNFDAPAPGALFNGVPVAPWEEMLGRFDLVNGVQIDHTTGDTGWVDRMHARNPGMIVIPYRLSYGVQNLGVTPPAGSVETLEHRFSAAIPPEWIMRGPDGSPLEDQIFEGNTQLDPTWYCPRIGGLVFSEFMARFLGDTVLPSGLWDGIHFDQSEWFPNPLLAQYINGPLPPMDMNRDGVTDSADLLFSTMRPAFNSYFSQMRERFGSTRALFGNAGRITLDTSILSGLTGWQQELLSPYTILANGDWDTSGSAPWHDFLRNYLQATNWTRGPSGLSLQFTGRGLGIANGTLTGHGYPNRVPQLEVRDLQRMRLGLTTTLLGNGFFGYDLVDNTTPPVWFDEYSVDAQGQATPALTGKGYLGQPMGAAQEITRPGPVVLETGFEQGVPLGMWVANASSITNILSQIIEGAAALVAPSITASDYLVFETNPALIVLVPGKTYDLAATFRVVDFFPQTYASLLTMGIAVDPRVMDVKGRSYAYNQDIQGAGQTITMRTQAKVTGVGARAYAYFGDRGRVAVDSVRLSEVRGGAFRRDFEGGIALVNPTPQAVTLTQAEIAGPLARTGIRRIAGTQDLVLNSGAAVTTGITIPPADGIILLATRITAPPPTTPLLVTATPSTTDSGLDLAWSTSAGGTTAGHLIEYKLAEGSHWDRFDLDAPRASHHIEFLHPGTAYDVRISAFDFAGRISAPSPSVRATTLGAAPTRATISSINPLVRSTLVSLFGTSLASTTSDLAGTLPYELGGARVTVNGVTARLAFVSPTKITFEVPPSVGFGDSVVRVHRAAIASAGFEAPVLATAPRACAADINGDGHTETSDFMILALNFGDAVPAGTGGDLNGDSVVNLPDFVIFASDFGCGT